MSCPKLWKPCISSKRTEIGPILFALLDFLSYFPISPIFQRKIFISIHQNRRTTCKICQFVCSWTNKVESVQLCSSVFVRANRPSKVCADFKICTLLHDEQRTKCAQADEQIVTSIFILGNWSQFVTSKSSRTKYAQPFRQYGTAVENSSSLFLDQVRKNQYVPSFPMFSQAQTNLILKYSTKKSPRDHRHMKMIPITFRTQLKSVFLY